MLPKQELGQKVSVPKQELGNEENEDKTVPQAGTAWIVA